VGAHVAANDVGYIAMLSGDYAMAEVLFADAIRLSPRYYETANENTAELRRRRAAVARAAP
jgi:Flp pilus assembly protein TadD